MSLSENDNWSDDDMFLHPSESGLTQLDEQCQQHYVRELMSDMVDQVCQTVPQKIHTDSRTNDLNRSKSGGIQIQATDGDSSKSTDEEENITSVRELVSDMVNQVCHALPPNNEADTQANDLSRSKPIQSTEDDRSKSSDEEEHIPLATLMKRSLTCVSTGMKLRQVKRKLELQYSSDDVDSVNDSGSSYSPSASDDGTTDEDNDNVKLGAVTLTCLKNTHSTIRNTSWKRKRKSISRKKIFVSNKPLATEAVKKDLRRNIQQKQSFRKNITTTLNEAIIRSRKEATVKSIIRNYHKKRLDVLLQGNELKTVESSADGNCFFQSVLTSTGDTTGVDALRQKICSHIEQNKTNYIGYVTGEKKSEQFTAELKTLTENGGWKCQLADCLPMVVANIYGRVVRIFSSNTSTPVQDIEPDICEIVSSAPIMLAYLSVTGQEHYDAVCPIDRTIRQSTHSQTDNEEEIMSETGANDADGPENAGVSVTPHKRAKYISPKKTMSSRKRKKNSDDWHRNKRKRQRLQGMSYKTARGEVTREKEVQPSDCLKCRYKCQETISEGERREIFQCYYNLESYELQRNFICQMVDGVKPVRSTGKRSTSRQYNFVVGDKKIRVCKDFFLKTLCLGKKTISCALSKKQFGSFTGTDERGRHESFNKTPDEVRAYVHSHISSFPTMEAHYCRKDSKRKYLAQDLSIKKMWDLYCIACKQKATKHVSLCTYRKIFCEEYNLSFFKPKKDQCSLCQRYNAMTASGTTAEELKEKFRQHQQRKKESREEKERDKQKSKKDKSFYTATFDLQAVLTTPCSLTGELYYTRKLNCYNLSIYSLGDGRGVCHLWDETQGRRGANEIATCLMKNTLSLCSSKNVKEITYWSDTCAGQNRNQFVAASHMYCVSKSSSLQVINQKFLESGHSQMECDSIHATIEGAKKRTTVFVPSQCHTVISMARKCNPYITVPLKYNDVLDFKSYATKYCPNLKVATSGERVNWLKIRWIQVRRDCPQTVFVNYGLNPDNFLEIKVQSTTRSKGRPLECVGELSMCYKSKLPVSEAKKRDLQNLCKKNIIPDDFHAYYAALPCSKTEKDKLPLPDQDYFSDSDSE